MDAVLQMVLPTFDVLTQEVNPDCLVIAYFVVGVDCVAVSKPTAFTMALLDCRFTKEALSISDS